MNSDLLFFLGVFWFIGLTIGWFFRNGISFIGLIVLLCLLPVFTAVSMIDWWPFTTAFVVGLLIHTWKPLYKKVQQL
ncbi:hypothetical protein [Pseudoalteromonas maricaloris]|uniref:hypothetical protein n=1 Tax=Pseudoalteromonas maricaloris TaxID=184924 RepID=UPI003C1CC581